MKIKEAIYDGGCSKCGAGKTIVKDEVYGCDNCSKTISSPYENQRNYLEIIVFYRDSRNPDHLQFCSWNCVFKFLGKIQKTKFKCDYFVSLPLLKFDEYKPGYQEFISTIRNLKK